MGRRCRRSAPPPSQPSASPSSGDVTAAAVADHGPMAHQLIIALFPNEDAADSAAVDLRESGIAKGDAIGLLVLDDSGKLKQDKVGAHSTGKGVAIGGVLAVTTAALLGPAVLAGAVAGALHHKSLGLNDADRERLAAELNGGRAAVGVLTGADSAAAVAARLAELGGSPESLHLDDD